MPHFLSLYLTIPMHYCGTDFKIFEFLEVDKIRHTSELADLNYAFE